MGASGSGKTTTSRAIAKHLGYPLLEIDSVYWLPKWTERERSETRRLVLEFAEQPRWVIDGNYSGLLDDSLDGLTDVHVWLDLPRWHTCLTVARRTVRRSRTKEDLWDTGNTETLGSLLKRKPLDNLVVWSWQQVPRYRKRWAPLMAAEPSSWVRLRSRREISRFVQSLSAP